MSFSSAHKVVLCGRANVGKTTLIMHFLHGKKPDAKCLSTIGADFFLYKRRREDGDDFGLQLWDTAGAERFQSIQPFVYRDARAIVFVYDITNEESFMAMETILGSALQDVGSIDPWVIVVGNKLDLAATQRAVSIAKAREQCDRLNYTLVETSAEDGTNVQQVLDLLCDTIHERFGPKKPEVRGSRATIGQGKTIDLAEAVTPRRTVAERPVKSSSACEC